MKIRVASTEDYAAIAKVHVDSWRETYHHIVPHSYLDQLSYVEKETLWQKILASGAKVYVAENDCGQIVGFANGGKERTGDYPRYQAEIYAIYILQSYQNKGIGKALIQRVTTNLKEQQLNGVLLWVLADNPSVGFYQGIGGKKVDEEEITIGGKQLIEVAYGWDDDSPKS
ncbi:Mycothiol acetyltransferase [Paraliobacillus sp. PM-2]|uniref:GNAT family N-acetyltransferase n=1 Tax=Paraliobacillus sp. PM-2 TaxID=1462524 RepID=UPI00061BDF72|nr:GNAT family N-acetyltransferase [Paraliobacillus sp. PM-2]CQR48322.1 Mycothiol acetyltransferase [Paraliobacillus sp. PM-2]